MSKRGRPAKLTAEQREELRAIVAANRTATLEEVSEELQRRTGVTAHVQTLVAALEEAGWSRVLYGSGLEIKPAQTSAFLTLKKEPRPFGGTTRHDDQRRRSPSHRCADR